MQCTINTDGTLRHLPATARGCMDDQFRCGSGECIPLTQKCNRRIDCIDQSDEKGCGECHFLTLMYMYCSAQDYLALRTGAQGALTLRVLWASGVPWCSEVRLALGVPCAEGCFGL